MHFPIKHAQAQYNTAERGLENQYPDSPLPSLQLSVAALALDYLSAGIEIASLSGLTLLVASRPPGKTPLD